MNHKLYSIFLFCKYPSDTPRKFQDLQPWHIGPQNHESFFSGYFILCNIILDLIHDESALSVIKSILVFAIIQRQHPFDTP